MFTKALSNILPNNRNKLILFGRYYRALAVAPIKKTFLSLALSENNENKNKYQTGFLYLFPFVGFSALVAKEKNEDDDEQINLTYNSQGSRINKFNFIADAVETILPSIVQIEISVKHLPWFGAGGVPSGSGFILTNDGYIVTNAHVVRELNNHVVVKVNDGRSFNGRVVKINKIADLALIKINCNDLKPARLGDSDKLRTGEFVIALGSPLTLNNTVTSGIVSNPTRNGSELGLNNDIFYIQTDTIVTHGNSGGPLVNLDGEVIGINSMTVMPGISFAIPSRFLNEFLDTKSAPAVHKTRYVGMKMITLTPQIYQLFQREPSADIRLPDEYVQGSLVIEVVPYSPSERAGMKRGDIIMKANGNVIRNNADLFNVIKQNKYLNLTVLRNNQELTINVVADEKRYLNRHVFHYFLF